MFHGFQNQLLFEKLSFSEAIVSKGKVLIRALIHSGDSIDHNEKYVIFVRSCLLEGIIKTVIYDAHVKLKAINSDTSKVT